MLSSRDEWNNVRKAKDTVGAKFIKWQRYNLLRRAENNPARQQARLDELLAVKMTQRIRTRTKPTPKMEVTNHLFPHTSDQKPGAG